MPLYPYRCTQCGHHFEKIQSFSAEPETVCPRCGGVLERPLTAPGLQFKGAGWYVNDYAPKSSAPKTESAPKAESAAKETKTPSSESSGAAGSIPATTPGSTSSSPTTT